MLPGISWLSSSIFTVSFPFQSWDWMISCSFSWHYSNFQKEYWSINRSGGMLAPTSVSNYKKNIVRNFFYCPLERTCLRLRAWGTDSFAEHFGMDRIRCFLPIGPLLPFYLCLVYPCHHSENTTSSSFQWHQQKFAGGETIYHYLPKRWNAQIGFGS